MRIPISVIRILMVLGAFALSSPTFSGTPEQAQQGNFGIVNQIMSNLNSFGQQIAGTYVGTPPPTEGISRILNVFADGNLTNIQSIQFGGESPSDTGFSNQHGTWKRIGPYEIEATVLDLSYDTQTGEFLGTAIAQYKLKFDSTFQTVTGRSEGKIFRPGVDPLNPGAAEPTDEFTDSFQAQRVRIGNAEP